MIGTSAKGTWVVLKVQQLSKRLGPNLALDKCSFEVDHGERLVIRGDNGAGKSTLLQILAAVLRPDRGQILLDGEALHGRQRQREGPHKVGYVPEAADPPGHLSVAELLHFVAAVKSCASPSAEFLAPLRIEEILGQRIYELSLGQRRRACLSAAFTGDPVLLLLDEPTNGLDTDSISALATMLAQPAAKRILICATHDTDFAKAVATREITLHHGATL
jgi:ABC-2 type transport system ATP-binding protein